MNTFRKDINSLRALAVSAVVCFHFYPQYLTGGFVGVDVFFVISGYLMTGIISSRIKDNTFNYIDFYLARANRIIPALAGFCIVMLLLGFFFLVPWDYKTVGRDVATSISFVSNIMFSMRGGYFSSEGNFFLHTWSLSTEWQFYILYPFVLLMLFKISSLVSLRIVLIISTIFLFFFGLYLSSSYETQSYFLLPSRAWEMLVGGLVFLFPGCIKERHRSKVSLFGLIVLLFSFLLIDSEYTWPGYLTLLPTAGAAIVILANVNSNRLIENKTIQLLGLWSYSIYLWHWPIVIFLQYFGLKGWEFFGVILSIILGGLSYYFIEIPSSKFLRKSKVKAIATHIFIVGLLGLIGSYVFLTQGIAKRLKLESSPIVQGGTGNNYRINEGIVYLNSDTEYDYLMIGDSNANHYTRGILKEATKVKQAWLGACMSFPNAIFKREGVHWDWKEKCQENYKNAINQPKPIILVHHWSKSDNSFECTTDSCHITGQFLIDLDWNMRELLDFYQSETIYLLGDIPRPQSKDMITCMKTNYLLGIQQQCRTEWPYPSAVKKTNQILQALANDYSNVHYISVEGVFCKDDTCKYDLFGESLFMPDLHLSALGSEIAWAYIADKLESTESAPNN